METTKDGFTFTRRTSSKQISIECKKIEATQIQGMQKGHTGIRGRGVLEDEFVFNRVSHNPRLTSKPTSRAAVNALRNFKGNGPDTSRREANEKETDESALVFNVVKKRRTIQMEHSIDLSTDTSLLQAEPEGIPRQLPCNNRAKDEEVIRTGVPTQKERMRSHEIHKAILSNNVNDLIKECIYFLRDDSKYAKEIIKHCNSNYFSDIDYRKEIELANSKNEQIRNEIDKWNKVFLEEKALNAIDIPTTKEVAISEKQSSELGCAAALAEGWQASGVLTDSRLVGEFEEKAKKLLNLEGKLRYFFENAKEKSENLLKNIFGSLEEKNVDAIFLLKAMSKLGR